MGEGRAADSDDWCSVRGEERWTGMQSVLLVSCSGRSPYWYRLPPSASGAPCTGSHWSIAATQSHGSKHPTRVGQV